MNYKIFIDYKLYLKNERNLLLEEIKNHIFTSFPVIIFLHRKVMQEGILVQFTHKTL